jgi:hypothetical protein
MNDAKINPFRVDTGYFFNSGFTWDHPRLISSNPFKEKVYSFLDTLYLHKKRALAAFQRFG